MYLQQLQNNLFDIIKSRSSPSIKTCEYLQQVNASYNLLLIRKVALWWRKFQIENFCRLTSSYLKSHNKFDVEVWNFYRNVNHSPFREVVGFQFLDFEIKENADDLLKSIAQFESAIIKLKSGKKIQSTIMWNYEPYRVIKYLLRDGTDLSKIEKGKFEVMVSWKFKQELFRVNIIN
jgi:hypothetical protein